jgi:hypothetical protein
MLAKRAVVSVARKARLRPAVFGESRLDPDGNRNIIDQGESRWCGAPFMHISFFTGYE